MQLSYRIGQIILTKRQQNETREGHDFCDFYLPNPPLYLLLISAILQYNIFFCDFFLQFVSFFCNLLSGNK